MTTASAHPNHLIRLDPVRRHPPRHRFLVVAACLALVALAIAPRAFAAVIGALFCLGAVFGFVAVRGVWRTMRRPLGSHSVGDTVLGIAALRTWNRHHPDRRVYPPEYRDWPPNRGLHPGARHYR
ncbi:MAG TPA: hypothetical protein VG205_04085 [Acidimicrobiales bacterium]|nr:hypothetical protein [Acidimicrobiales bacterium]